MRRRQILLAAAAAAAAGVFVPKLRAQELVNDESAPLFLTHIIPIPDTPGRFDHMSVDNKRGLIFATVFGNDTVEVLQLERARRIHTIAGAFNRPQAALYLPDMNRLAVSNSEDGTVKIFDGDSYKLIDTIKFPDDADNMRYDAAAKRVYVGYGDGAIGVFDATTNKRLEDYPLGVHPESFQLETSGPNIYVNLPDLKQIAVINRSTHAISRWALTLEHNFPMALDENSGRVLVASRNPAQVNVFSIRDGSTIATIDSCGDSDDLFFDAKRQRVYLSCGDGYLDVFDAQAAYRRVRRGLQDLRVSPSRPCVPRVCVHRRTDHCRHVRVYRRITVRLHRDLPRAGRSVRPVLRDERARHHHCITNQRPTVSAHRR
jgi:DNA-binding beta-propeller fold protein YncE